MPSFKAPENPRLHIGSGKARLEGWVNIDLQAIPGVDVVADVTKGLRFKDAEAVFAEHFLEHLAISDAIDFLLEAHRVLVPGGWMRLSTPNLDWVWSTHYDLGMDEERKRTAAIDLNRAFHGWRHQFLWNREILGTALHACGFSPVRWCTYGHSDLPVFQGIERHDTYIDTATLPHVIIAEAAKGEPQPEALAAFRERIRLEFLIHMAD